MKKLIFSIMMAFMCGMMVSCIQCSTAAPENDQTAVEDTAIIVKNDYFRGILLKIWPIMNKKYPNYAFYEASGHLKKLEKDDMWGVDHNTFSATYNSLVGPASVVVYVENDTLKFKEKDEPWIGDRYTTPFVMCDLTLAIKTLQKEINYVPKEGTPVVLRHQVHPNICEPQYIIGGMVSCHAVNAYSLKVDPLSDREDVVEQK